MTLNGLNGHSTLNFHYYELTLRVIIYLFTDESVCIHSWPLTCSECFLWTNFKPKRTAGGIARFPCDSTAFLFKSPKLRPLFTPAEQCALACHFVTNATCQVICPPRLSRMILFNHRLVWNDCFQRPVSHCIVLVDCTDISQQYSTQPRLLTLMPEWVSK